MNKRHNKRKFLLFLLAVLFLSFCLIKYTVDFDNTPVPITVNVPDINQETAVQFAVIGDFGWNSQSAQAVADLVLSWQPDFIITTGDNNYPDGSAETLKANVDQYYGDYIADGRFFPSLGNHDGYTNDAQPYLDFFPISESKANTGSSNNERYYDFVQGPIHFFVLDSTTNTPDGATAESIQAQWLKTQVAASSSPWQVVYFHHPPYSSGVHGSSDWMQWPFAQWGIDVVFSGHDHDYERLVINGLPYFVNGLGGRSIRRFNYPILGSQVRFNDDYGAMLITADSSNMIVEFHAVTNRGTLIDRYLLTDGE
ncbi:MAG: metallophosphoesterase [Ardenticatenaceae bacterium]|nr:metallophosphoesterase [Ardenticatenaceae bacterium]MCB8989841.1 metallophosphoesterase [Ardenticatenaceae bacterium]